METKQVSKMEGYLGIHGNIIELDPNAVAIEDGYNYKVINQAKVQSILQSYRINGYLASEPLNVEVIKKGTQTLFVVRKGHHRLHAAWLRKQEDPNFKVKAIVVNPKTNYQRELEQWQSNNVEKGSELEQGNMLWRLKESKDLSYAQVAEVLGILKEEKGADGEVRWVPDVTFVQDRVKLARDADGELIKALKTRKINYTTAQALLTIARKADNPEQAQTIQVEQILEAQTQELEAKDTLKGIQEVAEEAGEKPPTLEDLTNPLSEPFQTLPPETQQLASAATASLVAAQNIQEEAKKVIPGWESAVMQAIKDHPKFAKEIRDLGEAIEETMPGALVYWSNTRPGSKLWEGLGEDLQKECEALWLALEPQKGPKLRGAKKTTTPSPDPSITKDIETLLIAFNNALGQQDSKDGAWTRDDLVQHLKTSPLLRAAGYYAILCSKGASGFSSPFFTKA